jgi:hypothetical protein
MSRRLSQTLLVGLIAGMAALLTLSWGHPARDAIMAGAALGLIALSLVLERISPQNPAWSHVPRA